MIPLAIALFFFILFANWIEILPTELNEDVHLLPVPTADTNLTYAMASFAMISVWVSGSGRRASRATSSTSSSRSRTCFR